MEISAHRQVTQISGGPILRDLGLMGWEEGGGGGLRENLLFSNIPSRRDCGLT